MTDLTSMGVRRLLLIVPALAVCATRPVVAQEVRWEPFPTLRDEYGGGTDRAEFVAFLPGPLAGPDTLLAFNSHGVHRFEPDVFGAASGKWRDICYLNCVAVEGGLVTTAGSIVLGSKAGSTDTARSPDGGRTWDDEVFPDGVSFLHQTSLPALRNADGHGRLFSDDGRNACFSDADGVRGSWTCHGPLGGEPTSMGDVPPSTALPAGRLLATLYNGVSYSDDGGETWGETSLYGLGRWITRSIAFVPEGGHPYGGTVFAGSQDMSVYRTGTPGAVVHRSDDGGLTWAFVHRFDPGAWGLPFADGVRVFAGSDGALWASVGERIGAPPYTSRILRSHDGGATWVVADAGYADHTRGRTAVHDWAVARDGRLYVATDDGVWRTEAPVFGVAGASKPGARGALNLSVWPNPMGERATATLRLASPERVCVTVVDGLGREVVVAWDGPAADGQRVAVETAGLAPGVYRVVATLASGATASAAFTVVR